MDVTIELIEQYFEYFYKKIKNRKYKFTRTSKSKDLAEIFLRLITSKYKVVGEKFLWDYFVFQFQFWEGRDIKNAFGKLNFNNIIGVRPFERYENRRQDQDWRLTTAFIIPIYKLTQAEFKEMYKITPKAQPVRTSTTQSAESMRRAEFLNDERGFGWCIELTTLHDPNDKSCQKCNFTADCKALLKATYPQIYLSRSNEC